MANNKRNDLIKNAAKFCKDSYENKLHVSESAISEKIQIEEASAQLVIRDHTLTVAIRSPIRRDGEGKYDFGIVSIGILARPCYMEGYIDNELYILYNKIRLRIMSFVFGYKIDNILVTGWGKGGQLATLCGLELCEALRKPTTVVAFGSLKVGDKSFVKQNSKLSNFKMLNVQIAGDVKCEMPHDTRYKHIGDIIRINKKGAKLSSLQYLLHMLNFVRWFMNNDVTFSQYMYAIKFLDKKDKE